MKYFIDQKKVVTIKYVEGEKEKKLSLELPLEFEVTDEWVQEQINNPNLSKCINWLNKKGFYLKNGRYCLDYKKNNYIKLPMYFLYTDERSLSIPFGKVECNTFYLPRPDIAYTDFKNFPDLNKKTFVDFTNCIYENNRYSRISYMINLFYTVFNKREDLILEYNKFLANIYINIHDNYDTEESYRFTAKYSTEEMVRNFIQSNNLNTYSISDITLESIKLESIAYNTKRFIGDDDIIRQANSLKGVNKFDL